MTSVINNTDTLPVNYCYIVAIHRLESVIFNIYTPSYVRTYVYACTFFTHVAMLWCCMMCVFMLLCVYSFNMHDCVQAETIGSKDNYKPPVINGHNEPHVKETSFDGKESPQGDKKAADDDIVHKKQVMNQDQTPNMPPDDQAAIPLSGAHRNSKSGNESDEEDTSNVDIFQPRDVENEHEDGNKSDAAVDPVSQWQGEEHEYEQENNNADVKNTQPDVNDDSETLPSEEGTSSKGKADQQDLSYINHLNDAENLPLEDKPNPDVALKKAELLKFLKSKDLLCQAPVKCKEGKDPQSLEGVLTEYTALDILDENNKFICKTCSKNGRLMAPPVAMYIYYL